MSVWWCLFPCLNYEHNFFFFLFFSLLVREYALVPCSPSLNIVPGNSECVTAVSARRAAHAAVGQSISTRGAVFAVSGRDV